jgi:acyl dehydratase
MTDDSFMDSGDVALGVVAGPVASYVDPDEVYAFALAINDDNPRYLDGSAVPPTYAMTASLPVVHALPEHPRSLLDVARAVVHGEHEIVIHEPLTPGTRVHTTAVRAGAVPTKAGMVVVQRVSAVDDAGGLLIEQQWVTMLIGAARGEARGAPAPDHAVPRDARKRLVGRVTLPTTRDQTFRYAGASGDRNPMHVNDDVARQRGFPRKISQGLGTLGIATRGLIELAADGDPGRVTRIAVRFSAPAYPGDAVEVEVHELGEPHGGVREYTFEARAGDATVLSHGHLDVRAG